MNDGFPVPGLSGGAIRASALRARAVLGLPEGRLDIPRALDLLSEFGIDYDVCDSECSPIPPGVEACFVPETRTLYIRDTVYSEMNIGIGRAVFTFGHEIGHVVLAHKRAFNREGSQKSMSTVPIYCKSEWQANKFAAEFIMPIDQIQRHQLFSATAIQAFFGVSAEAARNRESDLRKSGELK